MVGGRWDGGQRGQFAAHEASTAYKIGLDFFFRSKLLGSVRAGGTWLLGCNGNRDPILRGDRLT